MGTKAVAPAPGAISEESAKTEIADRRTETQAVVRTTHADVTTGGNAPSVVGESQKDAEHISRASTGKSRSQAVAAAPTHSSPELDTENQLETLESYASGSQSLVLDTAVSVTLSEPDKVKDAVVPPWTKFADLSNEQKFEQARLMNFEVRDAYLRERCRAAKMEVDCAASALDRAAAIIEANLPFFIVHFEEMDAQGHRSDLSGKIVGKTEWLRQNVPDISKGTFYAALHAVKSRHAEQTRLMLGGEIPQVSNRKTHLTELQAEVVQALIDQGFKKKDAISMVMAAEGKDFESLFRSALSHGKKPDDQSKSSERQQSDESLSKNHGGGAAAEDDDVPEGEEEESAQDTREENTRDNEQSFSTETKLEAVADEFEAAISAEPRGRAMEDKGREGSMQQPVVQECAQAGSAADKLATALASEPDRDVASRMLTEYLQTIANQFANDRIIIEAVSARIKFSGRDDRILPGDWLEKRDKDGSPTLCQCVGIADYMKRRKVRKWSEGKWQKEHVIFGSSEGDYRVIAEEAARKLAPEAFPSSADQEGL